jgi:hypothetical protein
MTISGVGGANRNYQALGGTSTGAAGFTAASKAVNPHQFGPNDPLNQYLTEGDRSTIKAATGIDIRTDGTITISVESMTGRSVNDTVAAMDSVGQIASDRAKGTLSSPISADYLNQLIKRFSALVAANKDPFSG